MKQEVKRRELQGLHLYTIYIAENLKIMSMSHFSDQKTEKYEHLGQFILNHESTLEDALKILELNYSPKPRVKEPIVNALKNILKKVQKAKE
jgi:hypothetical protein